MEDWIKDAFEKASDPITESIGWAAKTSKLFREQFPAIILSLFEAIGSEKTVKIIEEVLSEKEGATILECIFGTGYLLGQGIIKEGSDRKGEGL